MIELALNAKRGIAKIRINPKAIIIDEEIRISHLVIGSSSIAIKNKN